MERLVYMGDSVKALDELGKVGGYLVRFSTEKDPDLTGDFFTAQTYFGPRDGDGADLMIQHGFPLKSGLESLANHLFQPIKTRKDAVGVWAEAILDLSDEYEATVHKLVKAGKLGWSSGTAKYLIRKEESGEIKRWPIVEGSLTPNPAEPRNKAAAIKSLQELISDDGNIKAEIEAITSLSDGERVLRDAKRPFSRSEAKVFVSQIKAISQRDVGELARQLEAQLISARVEALSARYSIPKSLRS